MRTFFAAGVCLILLGLLHLGAELSKDCSSLPDAEQCLAALSAMESFKIELFGNHTLMKFHNGFSLTMGLLFIAFGGTFFVTKISKPALLFYLVTLIAVFIVTITHFHALAIGLTGTALLLGIISFAKTY